MLSRLLLPLRFVIAIAVIIVIAIDVAVIIVLIIASDITIANVIVIAVIIIIMIIDCYGDREIRLVMTSFCLPVTFVDSVRCDFFA